MWSLGSTSQLLQKKKKTSWNFVQKCVESEEHRGQRSQLNMSSSFRDHWLPPYLLSPTCISFSNILQFSTNKLGALFSRSFPVFLCFSTILWLLTESFPSSHIWVICCWYLEIWLVLDAAATCRLRAELIHRPMVLAEFPGSVVQNTSSCYVQIDTVLFSFQSLSLLFCFFLWPSAWMKLIA